MQLYLIRHAESENNALYARTGASKGRHYDPALTDIGREQVRCLADFFRTSANATPNGHMTPFGADVSHVTLTDLYTSLMTRAVVTAQGIAEAVGIPLTAWRDVHECGGLYLEDETTGDKIGQAGPNRIYFNQHFPGLALPSDLDDIGWWNRGHEEHAERIARAQRVWQMLMQRHGDSVAHRTPELCSGAFDAPANGRHGGTDAHVGIVTHGGFYNYLLAVIFDIPPRENVWFGFNNAAITRIDVDQEGIALRYSNRFDFLPPELVT